MAFKEKRREERYEVDMTCVLGDGFTRLKVIDVSVHGLGILSQTELTIGEPLSVNVGHNDLTIPLRCVIRDMTKIEDDYRYGLEILYGEDQWLELLYTYVMKSK